MIITCPSCGNSGDHCQMCDGIGKVLQLRPEFVEAITKDIQPKPGTMAPGPTSTRRKK